MKERPIIMQPESVRAILAGTKTQTRRVMKIQPCEEMVPWGSPMGNNVMFCEKRHQRQGEKGRIEHHKCPYGEPGDRLWVKEALVEKQDLRVPGLEDLMSVANYAVDGALVIRKNAIDDVGCEDWLWQRPKLSAMFMPYWASRIALELTGVRVERVQDISEGDALAEGVWRPGPDADPDAVDKGYDARCTYRSLWDDINNKRGYGWDVNPWVWVLAFKRIEP